MEEHERCDEECMGFCAKDRSKVTLDDDVDAI
jgi:hypothetical protein